MKGLFYLLILLICAESASAQLVPDPANDAGWVPLWGDDFDQSSIDLTKWKVENNWDFFGKPYVYIDDNVKTENSNLVLTFKNEEYSCPTAAINTWGCRTQFLTGDPYQYTGGYVSSLAPLNFKYGYIEASIKINYDQGMFPAFWTFIGEGETSSNPNLPYNPNEIDIFEMTMGTIPNSYTMTSNLHVEYCDVNSQYWNPNVGGCPIWPYNFYQASNIGNWDGIYRVWSCEWNPDFITIYVDGQFVRQIANPGIIDPVKLILNNTMQSAVSPNLVNDMYVGYVNVYQLNMDCNTVVDDCSFWFGGYDEAVKKSIRIGYGGCGNGQPANTDLHLRATDYIEIYGDFTVSVGSEMTAEIVNCY